MNRVEADELIARLAAERERLEAQVVFLMAREARLREAAATLLAFDRDEIAQTACEGSNHDYSYWGEPNPAFLALLDGLAALV